MKKLIFLTITVAAVIACNPKTSEVTDKVESEFPNETVASGKTIFMAKCTTCHAAKVIDDYTKDRWAVVLPKMIVKAKLDEADASKVEAYVNWELEN